MISPFGRQTWRTMRIPPAFVLRPTKMGRRSVGATLLGGYMSSLCLQCPPALRPISTLGEVFDSHKAESRGQKRTHLKNADKKSYIDHIQSIGVGRAPRKRRKKVRLRKNRTGRPSTSLDSRAAEESFFRKQDAGLHSAFRHKKFDGSSYGSNNWMSPPPFGGSVAPQKTRNAQGFLVRRLPVKVLGGSGSIEEPFPRSSRGLPEVALAGRSNVGKSTLLNALLYGNQLSPNGLIPQRRNKRGKVPENMKLPKGVKAVTSGKPGETKKITLYQLSSEFVLDDVKWGRTKLKRSLVLADLPGYGFAYASPEKSQAWQNLMKHYLVRRGTSLKRMLLLVDARHGMKKADFDFLSSLELALLDSVEKMSMDGTNSKSTNKRPSFPPIQVVLTKCDLVSQAVLAERALLVKKQLSDCLAREPGSLPVMLVSARAGVGFNNVRGGKAKGGVLELQKDLAALVPPIDADALMKNGNQNSVNAASIGEGRRKEYPFGRKDRRTSLKKDGKKRSVSHRRR